MVNLSFLEFCNFFPDLILRYLYVKSFQLLNNLAANLEKCCHKLNIKYTQISVYRVISWNQVLRSNLLIIWMWDGNYLYRLPPSLSGHLITEHSRAVRLQMIWCCVLSLHDENQCRNVWRRMLGSDTTIRFFCLIYIFVSSMYSQERFRGWFLHPPIITNGFIKLWKPRLIWDFAPDFYTILMFAKLDDFLAISSPFKRSSQLFMAEFLSQI